MNSLERNNLKEQLRKTKYQTLKETGKKPTKKQLGDSLVDMHKMSSFLKGFGGNK